MSKSLMDIERRLSSYNLMSYYLVHLTNSAEAAWIPPHIDHFIDCEVKAEPLIHRNPPHQRRPTDYFQPELVDEFKGGGGVCSDLRRP